MKLIFNGVKYDTKNAPLLASHIDPRAPSADINPKLELFALGEDCAMIHHRPNGERAIEWIAAGYARAILLAERKEYRCMAWELTPAGEEFLAAKRKRKLAGATLAFA
jgi:hypothetical protein